MKKLLIPIIALCLTACDELVQRFVSPTEYEAITSHFEKPQSSMEVVDQTFSPDYKTFVISTKLLDDGPGCRLEDSTKVRVEVTEVIDGIRHTKYSTPTLVRIRNVEAEGVAKNDVRVLVLVDKTMPQSELDKVRNAVTEMRTVFEDSKLLVAFMDGDNVTKSLPISDYLLNDYFKHSDSKHIFLYRSMQLKYEEIMQGKDAWQGAERRVMITFSGDNAYDDNSDAPLDPDHYRFEEQLVRSNRTVADSTFLAYFVSMDSENGTTDENAQNIPLIFCKNHGGDFIKDFKWTAVKRKIYDAFHFDFPDNAFTFSNPDYKVYRGDNKQLTLDFYDIKTNKHLTSFSTTITMGDLYKPIIVHGHSIWFVVIQGSVLALLLLLAVYLVLQFIVPGISYLVFRHRYVLPYSGANMSFKGRAVGQTCYYCKAPFKVGENIVLKCEHTMHESCWEENDYHCTEYSDRCKHGAHYYNRHHIFDPRNATFYMKWILVAILAAAMAWLGFSLYMNYNFDGGIMHRFMKPPVSQIPFLGAVVGLFMTLGLSAFTVSKQGWRSVLQLFTRTLIATVLCYAAFLLVNVIILFFHLQQGLLFLDALAWVVSSFIIVLAATVATRVVYNKKLLLLAILLGAVTMAIWVVFYQLAELDYRVLLLLTFVIFGVGMALSIATVAPRSERYFLNVQGAVKTMDVALYKWFRNNDSRVVTIGKSVDCSLQLSWDIQSAIAPVQAEIRLWHKNPYLVALEQGVFINGKPVRVNRKLRLYHGKTFTIGNTTFTYIEKDR